MHRRPHTLTFALALAAALLPCAADAYIGPGAGVALAGSFMVLFLTLILAAVSILLWPFRALIRLVRHRHNAKPHVRRLVIVGFDGQDPILTKRFMSEGKLPNFRRLAEMGCFEKLRTSFPSVSPVAWSCFSTGTNPGRHNIFDFLDRDARTYLPRLSSTHIGSVARTLKVGPFRIPLGKPDIRLLRKSKPFWKVLAENDVWSTVLRVPITFPPDRFHGAQLSAMCVPDLLGTQGTFLLYTTRPAEGRFKEGGQRVQLEGDGDRFSSVLRGPDNSLREGSPPLELEVLIERDRAARKVRATIGDCSVLLDPGVLSDWVTLTFKAAPGVTVTGICRLQVTEMDEHLSLYITPINIDPEKPVMPVSHPGYYATYLAKRIGPYATLGLAEDTWALNEKVIDDGTFLKQTYDIDLEREKMMFTALDRLRRGCVVTVFDATDRIQHMFWRYLQEGHPAARGCENAEHSNAIEELYRHNDALVGRVLEWLRKDDLLIVLSDHGFASFHRGVNLNAWLLANGYLALKPGCDGSTEWLRDVDWSRTRAYAVGLTGMYLNVKGREAEGVVEPGDEARRLKAELIGRISGLRDEEHDTVAVNELFDASRIYNGPYTENAPDLLVGYNRGYRVSWDCATGMASGPVVEDNVKAWSGDHCVDPREVPGVLFCSRPIDVADPALIDVAPTALQLFGIAPAPHMEGKRLFDEERLRRHEAA